MISFVFFNILSTLGGFSTVESDHLSFNSLNLEEATK